MKSIYRIFVALLTVMMLATTANAKVKYTKASKLGMKKNAPEAAALNYQKLQQAIADHKNIKLNGTYYFSFPKQITLDYTLHITGGEMVIENGRPFDLANGGGLHATKTTFRRSSMKDSQPLIGGTDKYGAILATEVYLENCKVYGQQLLQLYFQDIDGSKTNFGIGQVVLKNNYLEGGGRVLVLDGIIRDKCLFEGNTYHEFLLTPIYICYNHSAKRYNNEAGSYKYVEENIRRSCTVDIVGNTFVGRQVSENTYYCAALVESVVCNFKRNTIRNVINYTDGKKLSNATCYDTYLSCTEVYYDGNTISDMISYSKNGGNKPLCEIGKSKINVLLDEGYPSVRHYTNNTYMVDATPLIAAGADPGSLYVSIFGNTDPVADYKWNNNKVVLKGAYLAGRSSSSGYTRFEMKNNYFAADSITGRGLCLLSPDYDMEAIIVENNEFESSEDVPFYLFNQLAASKNNNKSGEISIKHNTVKGTSPKISFSKADSVVITGNVYDVSSKKTNYNVSSISGGKVVPQVKKMNVEMPSSLNGASEASLSTATKGTFSFGSERVNSSSTLSGTYYLQNDAEFSIMLEYVKAGKTVVSKHQLVYKSGKLTIDNAAVGNGVVWKTLHQKDGMKLALRFSSADKQLYYLLNGNNDSENDKNTRIILTFDTK